MTFPKLPQAVSVALATGIGAAVGYVTPLLSNGVPDGAQLKSLLVAASLVFVSAVVHLYQPKPAPSQP
jgi:hypothetical protein